MIVFERICTDRTIHDGAPTLRGLRIPVATVAAMAGDGMTPTEIIADLPDLTREDIAEAIRYANQFGDTACFICPACSAANHISEEVRDSYCARCRWWTGNPAEAWQRPYLWTRHGKTPPPPPEWFAGELPTGEPAAPHEHGTGHIELGKIISLDKMFRGHDYLAMATYIAADMRREVRLFLLRGDVNPPEPGDIPVQWLRTSPFLRVDNPDTYREEPVTAEVVIEPEDWLVARVEGRLVREEVREGVHRTVLQPLPQDRNTIKDGPEGDHRVAETGSP